MVLSPVSGAESDSLANSYAGPWGIRKCLVPASTLPPASPGDFFVSNLLFSVNEKPVGRRLMRPTSFYRRFSPVCWGEAWILQLGQDCFS